MATLNITAAELAELIKMKNEGRIAEAWNLVAREDLEVLPFAL